MTDIRITIEAPDLSAAILRLADAIGTPAAEPPVQPDPAPVQAVSPVPAPAPAPVPVATAAPVGQTLAPSAPVPQTAVPVADAPAYTLDQISRAGAALVDAGKVEQLLALLAKYGVQAVTQLQPGQYGAIATELRALGAQI